MDRAITRRDFIHGAGAVVAGTALGWPARGESATAAGAAAYPPALTGLRGAHEGSFEVAHALGREGQRDFGPVTDASEGEYDLVVVGAGVSGLAAAFFYRERHPDARILLLDNHDDFGGHAKRNELSVGGRTLLGHGGSQTLEAPSSYSDVSKRLLTSLAVDLDRFDSAYDHDFYRRHRLGAATWFNGEAWGRDALVRGGLDGMGEFFIPAARTGKPLAEVAADMPIAPEARRQLVALATLREDRMEAPVWREPGELAAMSYFDFLRRYAGVTEPDVFRVLRDSLSIYFGYGLDATPAFEALLLGMPGLGATRLGSFEGLIRRAASWYVEPYIHHFPDGNASVARLLVRRLVPGVAPGETMEDVVTARFDYGRLDAPDSPVRIRLGSTVVRVEHEGAVATAKQVAVTYVRGGVAERVRARHCVLACWHAVVPHLCPELPEPQREAMALQVKVPLVFTNALLTNWRPMKASGVGIAYCPENWHTHVFADFPVSLGEYAYARTPDDPIVVALDRALASPGAPPRDQHRAGRYELLGTPFEHIERNVRRTLAGLYAEQGFDPASEIAAITVNRWPHGYAYGYNSLFDPEYAEGEAPHEIARRPFGRIAVANSDAAARAYLDAAIDEAWRAVGEIG